jgi:putative transposase
VLTEIKNRGVEDVCITVCDGLKGLPEAITTVWALAVVQTCIVHLIRNTFRYAARQYWDEMARDLRPVYTAPSEAAAKERFVEFSTKWGQQYPAITPAVGKRLERVRAVPGLRRRNPAGHLQHQRHRIRQRPLPERGQGPGPFPHRAGGPEMPLPRHPGTGPHRQRQARWATRWKPALNASAISFDGKIN